MNTITVIQDVMSISMKRLAIQNLTRLLGLTALQYINQKQYKISYSINKSQQLQNKQTDTVIIKDVLKPYKIFSISKNILYKLYC